MKILFLFGLGDTSPLLTAAFRRMGVDCDLLLSNRAFVTQYPAWTGHLPELENHVYIWDKSNTLDPHTIADLYKFVRDYDLIFVQPPGGVDAWNFGVPYVMWDGGSGNFIMSTHHESKQITGQINRELARRSYKQAKWVFFNDINVIYTIWKKLSWAHDRYSYMPLPVDTDVFHPMHTLPNEHFTAYLPTRQEVFIKGIEQILQGFKQFTTYVPDAQLKITRYGSDVPITDYLIDKYQLQNNIQWLPLVPTQQFAQFINQADVVIDQLRCGAIGGVTVQALACGQRVIVNANDRWYKEQLGEAPPILNAKNARDVCMKLLLCYHNKHISLKKQAIAFITKHFEYHTVAKRIYTQLQEILE